MKRPKTNKEYDEHITNAEPAMANVLECTALYEAVIYGGVLWVCCPILWR